ncbi:peptidase M23-like protein [Naumannella halotolerans]|uniref:Peptidase M23-like protein n=1 Tax=Naumannella halotolerans TaxID=993414 RepID=A0A4R7J137_9ACTN|nr:peptidase M23-like protein [Naumannella halotolerans]
MPRQQRNPDSTDHCSPGHPDGHHTASNFTDPETSYSADGAADYGVAAGTPIKPRLNGPSNLELKVSKVAPSCSGGGGGTGVQVEVSEGSEVIGFVSYLHLSDVDVEVGDVVDSDTVLGEIGTGYTQDENCWTGPHLHLEGFNRADYSCWATPSSVSAGSTLGRIGGSDVGQAGTACP